MGIERNFCAIGLSKSPWLGGRIISILPQVIEIIRKERFPTDASEKANVFAFSADHMIFALCAEYEQDRFFCIYSIQFARVVELVDTQDLKSCSVKAVRVRFPPRAPCFDE